MTELFGARYHADTDTLSTLHNAGLFSNLSVTLWALTDLFNAGIDPATIDFSDGFGPYQGGSERGPSVDLYSLLFRMGEAGDRAALAGLRATQTEPIARFDHHGIYSRYPFALLGLFLRSYFRLSDDVLAARTAFVDRYRIVPERTIAVVYRGTDKHTEVFVAPPDRYLAATAAVLKRSPALRVWIQTDQEQVRLAFHDAFGPRCFSVRELPTTTGDVVLHEDPTVFPGTRPLFATSLVAVASLLAECRVVINHTGNMAAWVALFRGSAARMAQFDQGGNYWAAPEAP